MHSQQCDVDEHCPVYEVPPPKYSAESILRILLDASILKANICDQRPTAIESSATYVVDITKLADPEDVKNDNFGM